MKKEVGLWIDHKKTVIVEISGQTEEITQIKSDMEKHVRFSGAAQEDGGDNQIDRQFAAHLGKYYDEVIARVRDAEAILILGPGEAKGEFAKQLQTHGLGNRIAGVETVDKLTDRQIAAKVREHFHTKN